MKKGGNVLLWKKIRMEELTYPCDCIIGFICFNVSYYNRNDSL